MSWLSRLFRRRPVITIEAKVIRADGRVEDLGVISKGKGRWRANAHRKGA